MPPARHPQSLPSAAPVLARDKTFSLHPSGPIPGVSGHGRVPHCSPQTQPTSPSRRQAAEHPAKGTLRGGQDRIPRPPQLPRRWREAVGRAGERTLTETLFSHPKNSSWPFPQLPGLANALPLDEKPEAATFRQRGCVCRGRLTQPK